MASKELPPPAVSALSGLSGLWPLQAAQAAAEYGIDAWQRGILTLDVLRERGNQYLEHSRSGKPPVLVFDYDVVLDAREFPKPANYALARIKPDTTHARTDPKKRPFVVIDPRAGHGPGIGGFKMDSEIGIALQHGHPCYFVMFFPTPMPGQTIESVCAAEIAFMRKVNELHAGADGKPFVIGNCQGGWALIMLAALAPDSVGPILLAGSPVSYWAGVEGKNPMRYSGGLMGGTWLASLAGDLGHGKFDGAYLVNNFESLNPSNTYWSKLYNLYSQVDTERERFLEFEKWWGGLFLMNKEEMEWITRNLFVGNKLSAGEVESFDGRHRVDIRNIRTPIVVFASWGDNITPPQQALNWIPDAYASVDEIRLNEQTIVYCLHEKIGHLGIFVSAGVAKRETSELASALDLIETLPPGLYEAVIQDTQPDTPGLAYVEGRYLIQFAPRTIEDILAFDDGRKDEQAFEVVERVAEINQGLYDTFGSPLVRAMTSETGAEAARAINPSRMERWALSNLNPWMFWVQALADNVRANRRPVTPDNPFSKTERAVSGQIEQSLDRVRDGRDEMSERMFKAIYEAPWLAAAVGLGTDALGRRGPRSATWEQSELKRLKRVEIESQFESGTLTDAWARLLLYVRREENVVDERPYNLMRRMIEEIDPDRRPAPAAVKAAMKRQAFVLALDEERAIAALPGLVPEMQQRSKGFEAARRVAGARGALTAHQEERFRRVAALLSIDDKPVRPRAGTRAAAGSRKAAR
ncbi:TerB family tellurite resistance protein [Variovorax sp. J22P168]|uniref:TerB family tellurite resistance protein n=1 Tax=Variovorax jilinensis TaxID=3053513 RepID=UPI0025776A42|nr:TerB family tellurite resistance protein [Variovorax sp. J22P168]MDM0015379.1 TerB family tellurite resistance protein [Variovorax sp. J22P168]